ncbi:MAG: hypothetical protein ABIG44_07655, partial [Planctomycetota bacterium]
MPPDTNQNAPDQSPAGDSDYIEIRHQGLQALLSLTPEIVTPVEREIQDQRQLAEQNTRRKLDEISARVTTERAEKLAATEQVYEARTRQIEAEYVPALEKLTRQTENSRRQATAEQGEIEKDAEVQRQDKLLLAETVAEATIKALRREIHAVRRQVAAGRARLEHLRDRAQEVLQLHECQPPAQPRPPIEQAKFSSNPHAAYEQYAQTAATHVQKLRDLSETRIYIGSRASAWLLLLNLVVPGAAAALEPLGVPHAPAFYIAGPAVLVVTLVVTLLVRGSLRRKLYRALQAEICTAYEPLPETLAIAEAALRYRS